MKVKVQLEPIVWQRKRPLSRTVLVKKMGQRDANFQADENSVGFHITSSVMYTNLDGLCLV